VVTSQLFPHKDAATLSPAGTDGQTSEFTAAGMETM
jgi:hypothetical protein